VVVAVFVLGAAVFELAPPLNIRTIVDRHLTVGRSDGLLLLAVLYLGASAAVQGMTFLYSYLAATMAQGILSTLRVRLYAHLQRLPTSYFDQTPSGDTVSRCTADVDTLDTVFSSHVVTLLANVVRLATISVAVVALSPPLTLVAALVMPPLVLVTRVLQRRVRDAERDNRIAVGAITVHLQESLRSAEIVRAFGREGEFAAGFRRVLSQALTASNRSTFFSALYTPATAILSALAVAALLWAGTQQAFAAFGISLGTLTAFLILLQRFFQPLTALGEEWQTVQGALAGAERIFGALALAPDDLAGPKDMGGPEMAPQSPQRSGRPGEAVAALDTPQRSSRPGEAVALLEILRQAPKERTQGAGDPALIVLEHVVFGYAPGQPVLHGVSLQVRPGEHVAVVGRTGAGKTSALHLLAGLYRPWAGTVRVAGHDPISLAESERRVVLGVVPQVVQLFSGTVLENLTLGDESIPEDAVHAATRIAGADTFIRALPSGYQTLLNSGSGGAGTQLSAGQQQLLALARALVTKPAVLLLDEATAAIDSASDAAFRTALRRSVLAQGCAVLTVAHRLSTAMEADRVIVLDRGSIVEEGAPTQLAGAGGRFAALLELEAAGWDWRNE